MSANFTATMADTPLRALGLRQTHEQLACGALDAVALTEHYLEAIERHNPSLNCFLGVDQAGAAGAAMRSKARWAAGAPLGLLDGIPVAVKDNIAVAGWRNTAGLASWRDNVAPAHGPVVQRLVDAGAVLLGRLNMDEAALSAMGDNPHYGRCHNPWAEGLTAGGSSGGSAVAVAAGLAVLTLGTDTMGSVRIPAAYCGVPGLKPSFGRLSTVGVVPVGSTFDAVGPLTRRAEDLFEVLALLSDPVSEPDPSRQSQLPRIGLPRLPDYAHCTPEVLAAVDRAVAVLEANGHEVVSFDAEFDAQAARRSGFALMEHELAHYLKGLDPASLSPTLAGYLSYGLQISDAKLANAREVVAAAADTWSGWLADYEVLLTPTVPHEAFPLDDPNQPDNQAVFTAAANFSGCPALSLPAGRGAHNMPLAVQFLAGRGCEALLRQVARVIEPEYGQAYHLPSKFNL